jgi:hypothetical protein|tara:strand:- start:210 stop:380 length:171 start_codon:yes stop_codon:yes gene_type:complete
MAEKKKAAPKKKATPKEKTPAWTVVQDESCWIVQGKNAYAFSTEEDAKAFLAQLEA